MDRLVKRKDQFGVKRVTISVMRRVIDYLNHVSDYLGQKWPEEPAFTLR